MYLFWQDFLQDTLGGMCVTARVQWDFVKYEVVCPCLGADQVHSHSPAQVKD